MKPLLRIIACAVAMCGVVSTTFADARAKMVADVMRKLSVADTIEIDDLLSPELKESVLKQKEGVWVWTDLPRQQAHHVSLTKKEDLQRFASVLKLTDERLRPGAEIFTEDGKKVTIYPPCQCLGDFQCRFLQQKQELLRFTIHHDGAFIRIGTDVSMDEFDIVPPFGPLLNEQIKKALKKANEAPTPTTVVPAAGGVSERRAR
jgi:hypothetical protein